MSFAVIVPTMGLPHLVTFAESLIRNWRGKGLVIYAYNPKEPEKARSTIEAVENLHNQYPQKGLQHMVLDLKEPKGFGGAVNAAAAVIKDHQECRKDTDTDYEQVIVLNDDIVLAAGWRDGLWNGHHIKKAHTQSTRAQVEVGRLTHDEAPRIEELGGEIGIVGGVSFDVSGEQNIRGKAQLEAFQALGLDEFSRQYKLANSGRYMRACFLSGFCMSFTMSCFLDCWIKTQTGSEGIFEDFPIGGFEDNDLCFRAQALGYQLIIALDTYFHHTSHSTLNTYWREEAKNGLHNRLRYYKKWAHYTQRDDQTIIAAYRLMFKCVNDLAQFRSSLLRTAQLGINGAAILLTGDPMVMLQSYDKDLISQLPHLEQSYIRKLVARQAQNKHEGYLQGLTEGDHYELLLEYMQALTAQYPDFKYNLEISDWQAFNERDERNRTHELAEDIHAEWIISIDSDEVLEDRLTPELLRRYTKHPDPLVSLYHFGWINHWETMNLVRVDSPFTNGLKSGMVGGRMWRVRSASKDTRLRIVGGSGETGLHCGNSPEYSPAGARIAGARFRHLSHIRAVDRHAKAAFYNKIDDNKNSIFISGSLDQSRATYAHISQADNVQVELYNPANGICFNMLCYSKEGVEEIAQKLDINYGVCDELVLIWTEESLDTRSQDLIEMSELFGVKWLHRKLDPEKGLSDCRNAGVEYIREELLQKGVSWGFFLDPDEYPLVSNHEHNTALRRCAEQNDCWGMMIVYKNKLPEGSTIPASTSQSVRMFKVDPKGIIKFSGRVHETLEESYQTLRLVYGVHPNVKTFPAQWLNMGLSGSPEAMGNKLRKYTELIVSDLEENPFDSQSWLSLGLQFINEGDHEKGEICFERSCMVAAGAFMPFKELATLYLNKALALLSKADARLGNNHKTFFPHCHQLIETISKSAPPHPVINTGEENLIADIELPSFPYDRISVDAQGEFVVDTKDWKENG